MKTILIILTVLAVLLNVITALLFDGSFDQDRYGFYEFDNEKVFKNKYSYKAFWFITRHFYRKSIRTVQILSLYFIWGYPIYLLIIGSIDLVKKFIKWV